MDHNHDDCLMERAALGDTEAFNVLVKRHQARIQRYAIRMLGGDQAAGADIAVGAFIRLWESKSAFQPNGKLQSWLIKTTHRLCLDEIQRRKTTVPLTLDIPAQQPNSRAHHVRDAVLQLPESHRAVLILSAYEGLSYEEIAEALDIPPGTVASRKNHAIALLRRSLTS